MTVVLMAVALVIVVIMTSFSKKKLGMGKKKLANYQHSVDKRLIPPPPYPHWPKLIIFTLRVFLIHISCPPPALIYFYKKKL